MDNEFFDSVSAGNSANQAVLERNRQIRNDFKVRKKQFANDVAVARAKVGEFKQPEQVDVAQAVASQVASKGKDLQIAVTTLKEAGRRLPAMANEAINRFEDFEAPADSVMRNLRYDTKDLLPETSFTEDVGQALKAGVSEGATVAERASAVGKLGLGATALGVGLGAKDVIDDIVDGKIDGKNAEEKISNVSTIASGALEGIGTALDLSGVGAPVGVALQAVGGLVGLFGSAEDIAGEEKEKKQAQAQVEALQKAPPVQEKLQAVQAGTAGEVKVN
jgi:hypothetical protein